ncbi:MAG: hypothetical protein AAF581_19260 [Planctomycetota bacterium]
MLTTTASPAIGFSRTNLFCACALAIAWTASSYAAPQGGPIEFPRSDKELYEWLKERNDAIPRDKLDQLTRDKLPDMKRYADEIELGGKYHIEKYLYSPYRTPCARMLARAMILNQARHMQAAYEQYKSEHGVPRITMDVASRLRNEYLSKVQKVVEIAAEPLYREMALVHEVHAESYLLRQRGIEAAQYYRKAIELDRYHPYPDLLNLNYINALHMNESWDEGEQACRTFFKRYSRSPQWPHVFFMLTKFYRYSGKPMDALLAWATHLEQLTKGSKNELLGSDGQPLTLATTVQNNYRRYLDRHLFYRGFYNMAMGKNADAVRFFEQFMDEIDSRSDGGEAISPATKVYRDYQAVPYHQFLIANAGKPAPKFSIGDEDWVVPPEDVGAFKDGNVQILVFGMLQSIIDRQGRLMDHLVQLAEEYKEGGLGLCWITNGRKTPAEMWEQDYENVANHTEKLGPNIAVALDSGMSAHAAYRLPAGTANVYLIDRKGNLAWRIIDPLPADYLLIRSVVDRLLREAP